MKILVTGSSGLVGTALVSALARDGHTVCRMLRPPSAFAGGAPFAAQGKHEGFDVAWNPATGELGGAGPGADAVVNLAGASIAGGRWTKERKALLHSSRIDTKLFVLLSNVRDRKSTRLNSSHVEISYAVFCLKKKKK